MCTLDFDVMATVWRETVQRRTKRRTALKHPIPLRRCWCCGTYIEIGQFYLAVFSVSDGYASTERACLLCAFALEEFCAAHDMRITPSQLPIELADCRGEDGNPRWPVLAAEINARIEARAA